MGPEPTVRDALMEAAAARGKMSEAVAEVSRKTGVPRDEVVRELIRLTDSKTLSLESGSPYASFSGYVFSPYSLWFWLGVLGTVLAAGSAVFTSGPLVYLRYVFGSALVFFLPGFALTQVLFARRAEGDDLLKLVLSVGLSVAITPVVSLLLSSTPFGVTLAPVLASLAGLTLLLLVAAEWRRFARHSAARGTA